VLPVQRSAVAACLAVVLLGSTGCRCVGGEAKTRGGLPQGIPCDCSTHPLAGRLDALACAGRVTDDGPAGDGGRLVVHLEAEPPHLQPLVRSDAWIRRITAHQVFEGLVRTDPQTKQIVPELAESFEISPDGLRYLFHLRRGVVFHDGAPLTAHDVEFTFNRLFDPAVTAESLREDLETVRSVKAISDDDVELLVDRPYFLLLETIGFVPILPAHVYATGDLNKHPANRAPVGSGPFRFERWDTGEQIVLRRFDGWWGGRAKLDEVIFRVVRDRTIAFQIAKRGDIDLLPRVTADQVEEFLADAQLAERFVPVVLDTPDFAFWAYNTRRPPFTDVRVRRAMTMLIDRDAILCSLERCLSRIVAQPWPPGHPAHDPGIRPLPYDPGAALALLAEAGWKDHDGDGVLDRGGLPFRFTFLVASQSKTLQQMATIVQQDLAAVGIDMEIALLDWSVFSERCRGHDFDVASVMWNLRWENDFHGVFSSDGAQNYGQWSDPLADRLVEEARGILDPVERNARFRELARVIDREQPYAFTFSPRQVALVKRGLVGARPSLEWFQLARVGWREGAP
jgi:peptide/nickel transport system substrate-binding protein